jgi:hypothetical protein
MRFLFLLRIFSCALRIIQRSGGGCCGGHEQVLLDLGRQQETFTEFANQHLAPAGMLRIVPR